MIQRQHISDSIIFLIVIMFLYAGISKLTIVGEFRAQMLQSPLLPPSLIPFLSYFVPLFELLIVLLLFADRTRLIGFYLSFFTMMLFSIYLTLLLSIDENIPCSCGGILGKMSYPVHIVFNLAFTILSFLGIFLENKRLKTHA